MVLITKSIQEKRSKKDGIRICIMRRPSIKADFDIWIPVLAPSNQLLDDYHQKKINWLQYEVRFNKEVIKCQAKYLRILTEIAEIENITLLCWETKSNRCHRRLVADACQKLCPSLEIIVK